MKISIILLTSLFCISQSANAWLGVRIPEDHKVIETYGEIKKLEIEKNTINLFVWNMYKANKKEWKEQFISQTSDYDFFLLQEMLTKPEVLDIFSNTDDLSFTTASSFIYNKNDQRTGVATGAKYIPTSSSFLRSKKREPILLTPKISLFTKYSISQFDEELLIVNIHAINFVSSSSLHSQLKEAINVIKGHRGPVIFAGDFNTWTTEKQNFLKEVTNDAGMTEVKFKEDSRKKIFGFILDFIFVRNLKVLESYVHTALDGSDHNAISAKLKFIKP